MGRRKEIEHHNADQGGQGCINGSGKGLPYAHIDDGRHVGFLHDVGILTDPVIYDDGIIYGVTNDGEYGRDKHIIEWYPEGHIHPQHNSTIVKQSYYRTDRRRNTAHDAETPR